MDGRGWAVVAGVLALVLLAGGACMCAGLGYVVAYSPDDVLEDEYAQREGMAEGTRGTSESCIVATHDRTLLCGVIDPDCTIGAQEFLRACLRAVPSPDPSLCDGVPPPAAIADWNYADQLCRARGWESDSGQCDPIVDALSVHCVGR